MWSVIEGAEKTATFGGGGDNLHLSPLFDPFFDSETTYRWHQAKCTTSRYGTWLVPTVWFCIVLDMLLFPYVEPIGVLIAFSSMLSLMATISYTRVLCADPGYPSQVRYHSYSLSTYLLSPFFSYFCLIMTDSHTPRNGRVRNNNYKPRRPPNKILSKRIQWNITKVSTSTVYDTYTLDLRIGRITSLLWFVSLFQTRSNASLWGL